MALDNEKHEVTNLPSGTRNVQRTLNLLRTVALTKNRGIHLSQIARKVNLPITTAKRILTVLNIGGYVSFNKDTKKYYLGYSLFELVKDNISFEIKNQYHSTLQKIANITGNTVYLIVPSGLEQLCIDVAEGKYSIRISYGVGSRAPLGLLAGGITILAYLPKDEVRNILQKNIEHYTTYNLTLNEIWEQIKKVKEVGHLRFESRLMAGLVGVAVPILDKYNHVMASIIVSSTAQRMSIETCDNIQFLVKKELLKVSNK